MPRRWSGETGASGLPEMMMPKHEKKSQRHKRLAKQAAKRMAEKPCTRTRNCGVKHIKEGLK